MAGKKRKKDHLKEHAGVELVEVVPPPSDSGDPLRWWTQHPTQACEIALHEFAEGQTDNPWGNQGLAQLWAGPFTGRPGLIRELAPHFKANQWPDFGQASYADGVYRAYKVEPYFTTNRTTDADNTRLNVRDRNNRTLTPLDQGNSQADVDTTAQIRKEIIARNNMSVNARNVKIITNKGRVTLRGPVSTAEEKSLIGGIADRIAQPENVDNQLEVKLNTLSK